MSERCKHVEKNGFNCGSYAFNLYKDGIDQGNLCDVHYWQAKALAQPELCKYGQEPASCTSNPMDCQCAIDAALAQPEQDHIPDARKMVTEQEPVAWMFQHDETGRMNYVSNDGIHNPTMFLEMNPRYALVCPLYTTPPQRTWVGLTDKERFEIRIHSVQNMGENFQETLCKAIEAKLKQLNT
jgi:hypothetical protein